MGTAAKFCFAAVPLRFFGISALQNGVDSKTVSGMPGHFSVGFTLDTYAHVTTSAQKEVANTMGGRPASSGK